MMATWRRLGMLSPSRRFWAFVARVAVVLAALALIGLFFTLAAERTP